MAPPSPGEFLKPLRRESITSRTLAAAYFLVEHQNQSQITTADVKSVFKTIRDKRGESANISQIFSACAASGYFHNTKVKRGPTILWELTETGRAEVQAVLGIDSTVGELDAEIRSLTAHVNDLTNADVRDYLAEAIACLRVSALRAAIVFVWAGAVWTVQEWLMTQPLDNVNEEIRRHQPKAKEVRKIDDFAYINDSTILIVARDLGLWDKGEHQIVEQALQIRNQCGHPSRFKVSVSRSRSLIEELFGLVFTKIK